METSRLATRKWIRWSANLALAVMASCCHADKYAVLIGVNSYADSTIPHLNGAVADARGIAKTLIELDGFPAENVHLLLGDKVSSGKTSEETQTPTLDNIGVQLDWLTSVVKPGDTVFFFFAGHGVQYEDQAWLLPYNANVRGKFVFEHSALPADLIRKTFDKLPCLLVSAYDMCRREKEAWQTNPSRGLGFGFRLGQIQERSIATVHTAKTDRPIPSESLTIFACQPSQFSWESRELGRGFFSKCLQEALSYSDDASGSLTIRQIVDRLRDNVLASVGAYGLSENQEPDAFPSNDSVYRRVFASGLKPRANDSRLATNASKRSTSDLSSRDAEDAYVAAFQSGFLLYKHKKYHEAEASLRSALELRSTAAALRLLGDCRYRLHDKRGATAWFNKALQADSQYSPAYSDLGYIADIDEKDPKKAEDFYRKAIACDPGNPAPVNNIARVLKELRKSDECLQMYLKAVDIDPNSGLYEANLALEYFNQHQLDLAKRHAEIARALGLEDHRVFDLLHLHG